MLFNRSKKEVPQELPDLTLEETNSPEVSLNNKIHSHFSCHRQLHPA
jgi:hypothetical protein